MDLDLTATEAAKALRVSTKAISKWYLEGKFPGAYKVGKSLRIPPEALQAIKVYEKH